MKKHTIFPQKYPSLKKSSSEGIARSFLHDQNHQQEQLSQDAFNYYMRHLPYDEPCKFMIKHVVSLCGFVYKCPYQGKETFTYKGKEYPGCKREEVLRYKKILGVLK